MDRIDKIISSSLSITRSEARDAVKHGRVCVNGKNVKSPAEKADAQKDKITVDNNEIVFCEFVYIMMNKPKGVISSTDGKKTNEKTVIDILPENMKRRNLFPAGRLDKNTTGFILITDDGKFAHDILSPKKHISKTYIAELDKPFDSEVETAFSKGVVIGEDVCLPALLESVNDSRTTARVTISQGMYHQIKRMFSVFGIEVVELKRIKMGKLELDENLLPGECRYLSKEELNLIKER